jgi:competence protein ComEA
MTPFHSVLLKLMLLAVAVGWVLALGWPAADESPVKPAGSSRLVTDEARVMTPDGEAGSMAGPDRPPQPPMAPIIRGAPDTRSRPAAAIARSSLTPIAKVDLNRATAEQLQELPGIGETLAARVLHRRATHGTFRSVDELLEVKGIGRKRLERLRPLLMVSAQGKHKGPL